MLLSAMSLMADDGGVTNFEDWTYGNIYVKEPNDRIALEKELMVCDMDSVRAFFVFKNTTNDTVVVDCAFPIDVKLPYNTGNNGEKLEYEEEIINRCYSYRVLTLLLGSKKSFEPREIFDSTGQINLTERVAKMVRQHDKELKLMNISQYYDYVNSLFKEEYRDYIPNCIIEQDGKSVDLLNVGIESTVDAKHIKMQFHFHHKLVFLPNAYSKVTIKYDVESIKQTYDGEYSYYYDISTGGTWKDGKIKSFMLVNQRIDDFSSNCELNYLCFDLLGDYSINYKKEFRPQKDSYFLFRIYTGDEEHDSYPGPTFEDLKSVQIRDIKSSPSLLNVDALFDKNRFTSCLITNCQKDFVEFTLTHDAYGPFIYNGTIGKLVTKEFYEAAKDSMNKTWTYDMDPNTYFPEDTGLINEGVSKIFIESLDSSCDTFSTYVGFSDPREVPYVFEWDRFNDAEMQHFFSAGRYRLSFKDCDDSDSLRITEIWFNPIKSELIQMMKEDKVTPYPLFQTVFEDFSYWKENGCYFCPRGESSLQTGKDTTIIDSDIEPDNVSNEEKSIMGSPTDNRWLLIGCVFILVFIGGVVWWIKKI